LKTPFSKGIGKRLFNPPCHWLIQDDAGRHPFWRLRLRHPPISIPAKHLDTIHEYTRKIAIALKVVGLVNIQYAIAQDTV